jgi:2-hydroxy-6-oxonona-2,4-dienedioate hydrolase
MNNYNDALKEIARLDETSRHYDIAIPGGGKMRWRRFGAGEPLVLIHGGHGSWLHWARNIEALAQHYTVWVPDLPGFGDSDEARGATPMDALLDAVALALDQLVGAQVPVHIAGFSFGTLVTMELAVRRPVRRLALLGVAGHGGARRPFPAMVNWRLIEGVIERRDALTRNMKDFMLYDPAVADPLAIAVYELSCVATRFRSKDIALTASLRPMLEKLRDVPVLAVWGDQDVTLADPGAMARQISVGLPNAHWYGVPSSGHWVQYESAREINHALLGWLANGELPRELVDLTVDRTV